MHSQKRVALINDMTGFGRCSITVELPIISALGVEVCPLPTAVLSVHTAFPNPYIQDETAIMRPYMENWKEHQVEFDGICTGFLGSVEQVSIVRDFIHMFKRKGTLVIVDPVMGDWGRLYSSYSEKLAGEMKKLLPLSDVITPNLTEAVCLLDEPYPKEGIVDDDTLYRIAEGLSEKGPKDVVITGISRGNEIGNFIYEEGKSEFVSVPKIGMERSGTGDVFTGVVTGMLLSGHSLSESVGKAAGFVSRAIAYTEKQNIPPAWGLVFEPFLREL